MALTPTRRGVRLPDAGMGGQGVRRAYWAALVALLAANLAAAALHDPPPAGRLPADGATYTFEAASVAFDLDLQYGKEDHDRFVAARGGQPGAVVLRSPDRGERITYGVPIPYAVFAAPVVRFAPVRGLPVANALFLAVAALGAAATLERRLGPTAPVWVAALVFGSVAFAATHRPTPELFAASAVALAFALAYRGEGQPSRRFTEIFAGTLPGEEAGRAVGRWIAVGALVATAAAYHPFYLALLMPLALVVPKSRRRSGLGVLLLATGLVLAAWGGLYARAGGSWFPWDRGGRVFTPETGFPAVNVPVSAWPDEEPADPAWAWLPGGAPEVPLDRVPPASLWGWNLLFLAAGRHLGLLPYFLPALLGFLAFQGERGRSAIPLAVGAALVGILLVRPFSLAAEASLDGGGAAGLGNGFFLVLYPALWFLAARPLRPAWMYLVVLLASPYVYPAWVAAVTGPAAAAVGPSPVAARLLPLETTQTALPGVVDLQHGALWLRFAPGPITEGPGDTLRLAGDRRGDLWVGSPLPVPALQLELLPGGPTQAEVAGAKILRTVLRPDGGVVFVLEPGEPHRSHRVAWSSTPYAFYHLAVRFPAGASGRPFAFRLVPLYEEP